MLTRNATLLRPYADEDLEVLSALRNDVALQSTLLALPRGSSLARVRAWASSLSDDREAIFLIVADAQTGRAGGFIQLTHLDFLHGHGELGIALSPDARGSGHGANAIGLLEDHARDVFGIRKITLRVLESNAGAVRLYDRLGYRHVGILRQHFYHRGAHHDVAMMEKLLVEPAAAPRQSP
jgi:diamine N-acetyltransferase